MEEGRGKIIRLHANASRSEENGDAIRVDTDRITQLPDSIISIILSFLPTKTAVSTSVLSTRWRFLWTTVFNLDFSHSDGESTDVEERNRSMEFAQFVSKVLLHQRGGHINKLCLKWCSKFIIPSFVSDWVSTAIIRHVQELQVVARNARHIQVPLRNIFTSETLLSLDLSYCNIFISSAMPICLPRLQHLELFCFEFLNPEAFEQFITGCPVIKYLDITVQEPLTSFKYIVSSASLTELHFRLDNLFIGVRTARCIVELDVPNLEVLDLEGVMYWISIRGSLNSLVKAALRLPEDCEYCEWEANYYNSIVLVVRALSSAKSLFLSSHVVWAMSYATIRLCTKFDRLTELDVGALRYYGSSIVDLIQCSENMQVLTLWMECRNVLEEVDPDGLANNLRNWRNPEDIPICFLNTLKTVKICKYNGADEEYAMMDYILQSGSLIEVMEIIVFDDVDHKFSLLRDICALSRKSPTCKIEFLVWK